MVILKITIDALIENDVAAAAAAAAAAADDDDDDDNDDDNVNAAAAADDDDDDDDENDDDDDDDNDDDVNDDDDDNDDDDNDDDLIFTIVTVFCHIYINKYRSNLYCKIAKMIIQWKSFRTESPPEFVQLDCQTEIYILQDVTYNHKRRLFPYIRNGFIVRPESIASTKFDFKWQASW